MSTGGDIVSLFRQQVARAPDAVAVETENGRLSYGRLDSWTDRLAGCLPRSAGSPDSVIALCVPRSAELVALQLAILKAGSAYLPLDPTYPPARLAMMCQLAHAEMVIVADRAPSAAFDSVATVVAAAELDDASRRAGGATAASRSPESLVYVMFTSGTSGVPKAVLVEDRNVANLCLRPDYVHLDGSETLAQLAPASFDAATFEIWGALLNGCRLVVPDDGPMSTAEIEDFVQRHGVTTMWLTAALFHQVMCDSRRGLHPVGQLLTGGDVVSPTHVRAALECARDRTVINGYGPTETTTFATCHAMRNPASVPSPVPIGYPIRDVRIHITDPDGGRLEAGAVGEIVIAGAGVSRGYLGGDDPTRPKFVPEPTNPSCVAYNSGDLGRRREDGVIEFHGRKDLQIKVRGHRIEPVEIERELLRIAGIQQALVDARRSASGEKRLVAYLRLENGVVLDRRDIRKALATTLPRHMLPAAYSVIERIPLTSNGKADRRALPEPDWHGAGDPLLGR